MSSNVVSLIALVPMLIHSIFGCCWHHGHSHAGQDRVVAILSEGDSSLDHDHAGHSSCPSHGLSTSGGEQHSGDRPLESPCEEDRCVYSGLATTVAPQLVNLELWAQANFMMAYGLLMQQPCLAVWGELSNPSISHSARERRALTQIWLI